MIEQGILSEIEIIKKKINDNVAVNDDVVCGFCDELISLAEENEDWNSVAFGYVWRADYYFYVAPNMKDVSRELDYAEKYIDKKNPSELLEKFYILQSLLHENSFDVQVAFHYCLNALGVAERLDIKHRIGANYGTIGTYFLNCNCYEEALTYTNKAMKVFRCLPETKPRLLRLLLINLIAIYFKLGQPELIKPTIEELSVLPVEEKDLKIYVDYGYLLYYSQLHNQAKSVYYLQEMFNDGLMDLSNRVFVIEILTYALEAMILIKNKSKANELLDCLQSRINNDEPEPLLELCRLKIKYSQQFETKKELYSHYREYHSLYLKAQDKASQLKVEGFCAKVELNDMHYKFKESRKVLKEMLDIVNFDELTKVYNRRYLNIKQDEIVNSREYTHMGFAIVDIDFFKEYNDFYGHLAGDEVLKQVADCLQKNIGEQMAVFRYGGDEFVCLFWGLDYEKIEEYIKSAVADLERRNIQHLQSRCAKQVTLSIGYGNEAVETKFDVLVLFDEVDRSLYAAKNNGRNNAKSILDKGVSGGGF